MRSVLEWAELKKVPAIVFHAARCRERWETDPQVVSTQISEPDFDRVIHSVQFDRL